MRSTRQRTAVRDAFQAAGRPLGPQEVLAAAQRRVPRLGIATVYRHIKALLEEGWLREVELPGAPSRYEVDDKEHHHHFHCRKCDGVFEVDACPGNLKRMAPRGFRVEAHEIILYGVCKRCGGT